MLRFAPSPTGDMHVGNLRVALLNYIVARQRDESFILRIEDTDTERNVENGTEKITKVLETCGIDYRGINYQSLYSYDYYIKKMTQVYKECFRGIVPIPSSSITYTDVLRGNVKVKAKDVGEFRFKRDDGSVLYNFACACDDTRHNMSLIIRGEDHISNTAKQVHIKNILGLGKDTEYLHLPIIKDVNGKKLSKRDNSSSVEYLISQGYLPQAIVNYLLGMGHDSSHEIYTLEEAISRYDITSLSTAQPTFDIDTLKHYNREHLKLLSDSDLIELLLTEYNTTFSDRNLKYAKLLIKQCSTMTELLIGVNSAAIMHLTEPNLLCQGVREHLMCCNGTWKDFLEEVKQETGLKGKELYTTLRTVMTGIPSGPALEDVYNILYLNESED